MLISAGKRRLRDQKAVYRSYGRADRKTREHGHRQRRVTAVRDAGAKHEAERENGSHRQINPADENNQRLPDRDQSERRDLLTEKKQPIGKQERRNENACNPEQDSEAYERRHGTIQRRPLDDGGPDSAK